MVNSQILKNVHSEVDVIYKYLKKLSDKRSNNEYFGEPEICFTIRQIDENKHQYNKDDYFRCQIANKLNGYKALLGELYLPVDEPDFVKREILYTKYVILDRINKLQAFDEKSLNKLLMRFPINPVIPAEITENFYNHLMEV